MWKNVAIMHIGRWRLHLEVFQVWSILLQPLKQNASTLPYPALISGLLVCAANCFVYMDETRRRWQDWISIPKDHPWSQKSESSLMVGQDAAPVKGFITKALAPNTVNGMCQSLSCCFLFRLQSAETTRYIHNYPYESFGSASKLSGSCSGC